MSGKLLVVGDSIATRYVEHTKKCYPIKEGKKKYIWNIPKFKYWFELLSDKLNLKLINYSDCGSGNQQIFDNTLYALNEQDDIKFAVIVWSGFDRIDLSRKNELYCTHINLADTINYAPDDISKKYNELFRKDGIFNAKMMINKFINYSITLDTLFKSKDIKLLQTFSIEPYMKGFNKNRLDGHKVYNDFLNHKFFNKINEKQFFNFPGTQMLGGKHLYQLYGKPTNGWDTGHKDWKNNVINSTIDDEYGFVLDPHPNGNGNKIIFDELYRFTLDNY